MLVGKKVFVNNQTKTLAVELDIQEAWLVRASEYPVAVPRDDSGNRVMPERSGIDCGVS